MSSYLLHVFLAELRSLHMLQSFLQDHEFDKKHITLFSRTIFLYKFIYISISVSFYVSR